MTHRERIERQMNFEPVDHLPLLGGWLTSGEQYAHFAGVSEEDFWADPEGVAIRAYRNLGIDGLIDLFLPPGRGAYTHVTRKDIEEPKSKYPTPESVIEYLDVLPSAESLERTFDPDAYYEEVVGEMLERQRKVEPMVWMPARWGSDGAFGWYGTFGYESYLAALALYPGKMRKLFEYAAEEARLKNEVVARVYEDHSFCKLLLMGEDICGQSGPMVSVGFLKEVFFPLSARAVKPLLDAGFKLIWHSDGNVMPIADLVIGIGVAGFQGFQWEAGTTIEALARRRTRDGKKLIFFSGMNVTRTMPEGSNQDVRRDIDNCAAATGGSGLFILPSNTINPDARLENIRTAYDYARGCSRFRSCG